MKLDHTHFLVIVLAALVTFAIVIPVYNKTVGAAVPALAA